VVDPSGLVMVGNDSLEGGLPRRVLAAFSRGGGEVSMTPTDLKVLFGNEATEHEATIVARDSNLGLCFIQITDPDAKVPDGLDLSKGVETGVGQAVFTVTRKPRGYDCAPVFGRLFVTGRVEKPRPMLAVAGTAAHSGFPAFDASGAVVGVISTQSGSEGVDDTASESFILPVDTVRKVLDQAKKRVPEILEKAKTAREAAKEGAKGEPKDAPKEPAMGETPPAEPKPK
jgi:S1-C subfamily serine protease